jgi:RNA polymerase sigma factor (sigma-70 family)
MTAEFDRAFLEIATHKRQLLKQYASRWGEARADDAVQEGLRRLWTSGRDKAVDNLLAYAKVCVRNAAIDARRLAAVRLPHVGAAEPGVEIQMLESADHEGELPKDPLKLILAAEKLKLVDEAWEILTPLEREVVRANRLDGESARAIGERLNLTADQVYDISQRGLKKLGRFLDRRLKQGGNGV